MPKAPDQRRLPASIAAGLLLIGIGLALPISQHARAESATASRPKDFVDIVRVVPGIRKDIRYFTANNFVGEKIDGYHAAKCLLTAKAAEALKRVQADLKPFGLGLKIYDCYRPQRAVNHFIRWAKDLNDTKMKSRFYPDVAKKDLFKEGYIAARSSHTRGSTVDLTLVAIADDGSVRDVDMGTGYDLFSPRSWPTSARMTGGQRAHRMLLQTVMIKHGFAPYPQEWWHFTLKDEPYPKTYFDFAVE
jgi:D-alanyl-D-alanine dipeptidase